MSRARLGRKQETDAALDALVSVSEGTDPFLVVEAYAYRGDADAAFRWLGRTAEFCQAVEATPQNCYRRVIARSPIAAPLLADARWDAATARMRP